MSHVIIFQPPKSAMQSGKAQKNSWSMEFAPTHGPQKDPIMGWESSRDMDREISLTFSSAEEAIAFALKNGFTYEVHAPRVEIMRPKNYGQNFSSDRRR